jgi:hypothetical protein
MLPAISSSFTSFCCEILNAVLGFGGLVLFGATKLFVSKMSRSSEIASGSVLVTASDSLPSDFCDLFAGAAPLTAAGCAVGFFFPNQVSAHSIEINEALLTGLICNEHALGSGRFRHYNGLTTR